jgi:hypothetical protein
MQPSHLCFADLAKQLSLLRYSSSCCCLGQARLLLQNLQDDNTYTACMR